MELASKGQNIILVSRTLAKLQTVAKEIEEKYKVKTKVVDIDFSKEERVQERIEAAIEVEILSVRSGEFDCPCRASQWDCWPTMWG